MTLYHNRLVKRQNRRKSSILIKHLLQNMNRKQKQLTAFLVVIIVASLSQQSTHQDTVPAPTRLLSSYLITTSRYTTVSKTCGSSQRPHFSNQETAMSKYVSTVNAEVGINGKQVIRLAAQGKSEQAKAKVTDNSGGYLGFILTFGLGLVVLLLSFPFMMCCCICKGSCPPKCCGRKSSNERFERYDLLCPLVTFIVLAIFAAGLAIYAANLVGNRGAIDYKQGSCQAARMADDIMNGNTTTSGSSFFIGFNNLPTYLNYLKGNLSSINSNLAQIRSSSPTTSMNQAIAKAKTAEDNTIKISNNDPSGSNLVLTYSTPLDTPSSTGTIASNFPEVLGSYSSKTGLVWRLYSEINSYEQLLSNFKANATDLNTNLAAYTQGLNSAVQSANDVKISLSPHVEDMNDKIEQSQEIYSRYHNTVLIFSGVVAIILFVSSIAAYISYAARSCCCCHKFVYLLCFLLFWGCLFGFLVATFLSSLLPVYSWGCDFFNETISSQYHYQNNLNAWIDISTLQKTGVCMPFGDGNIYQQFSSTAEAKQFDTLKGIFTTLKTFEPSSYTIPISAALTSTLDRIDSYAMGKLMDITEPASITVLQVLSDYSTGSYTNCNANAVFDSWVPSNNQDPSSSTIIPCKATNGKRGDSSTCSSGLSSTSSCSGCMDSSEVLFRYLNPTYSLPTDLSLRYGSICSLNAKLNNVWNKYYKVKLTALGPTVAGNSRLTGVYPRTKTVESDISSLNSVVTPGLTNTIATINSNLASISSLTDPTYGIFGSVNCKVIGEDAERVRGTTCGTEFTKTYLTRIIVGTLSYLILVALFFLVAYISRRARWQQEEEMKDAVYHPDTFPSPSPHPDDKQYAVTYDNKPYTESIQKINYQ